MEKYSGYRDRLSGINPFLQPVAPKLSVFFIFIFLKNLFFYGLYRLGFNTINYFIKIKGKTKKNMRVILSNRVSVFDRDIMKYLFPNHKIFYNEKSGILFEGQEYPLDWNSIVFVEECNSNNECLMRFYRDVECDHICILKYSNSCIYMYGSYYKFLFRFLASNNFVEVKFYEAKSSKEFKNYITQVDIGEKEREMFMEMVKNE